MRRQPLMRLMRVERTNRRHGRRGIALLDAIVGGIILAIGLAVLISLASRSLAAHSDGEHRLIAAWLADELLSMVLIEGPDEYAQSYDLTGRFYPPFEDFTYEVILRDQGEYLPHEVTAVVYWPTPGRTTQYVEVQTLIADRLGDDPYPRQPMDPIDREQRHFERRYGEEMMR